MDLRQGWQRVKKSREFEEFYFFAVALILAFGTLQTTGTVMDTDKPVVTVVSCSMYPHYDVGDVILVQGQEFESIEEGDIAVYESGEPSQSIPVIHRVVVKNQDYLETRGDNNQGQLEFEERVEPEQIYGTAVASVPKIGMVKLIAMDIFGLSGPQDGFLEIDSIPQCSVRT
jgi:signal peptidase I